MHFKSLAVFEAVRILWTFILMLFIFWALFEALSALKNFGLYLELLVSKNISGTQFRVGSKIEPMGFKIEPKGPQGTYTYMRHTHI